MADKQITPGDLVYVDNDYLSVIYTDAFNHKHSVSKRPFLVLGKHQNYPSIAILAPISSRFYYNYTKLERRTELKLEEDNAPSVVLISNNAPQTRSFFNGAVLLDQSIAVPFSLLSLYRIAFKEYVIGMPQEPTKPLIATNDPSYKKNMLKYESAVREWEKCSNTSLYRKVNINWFVANGKSVVKHLSARGKMDFDILNSLGIAYMFLHPDTKDY